MKHTFLDLYRDGDSRLHRLDARVKFLATVGTIVAVSLLPPGYWPGYLGVGVMVLASVALAGIPFTVALRRSVIALPFALVAAVSLPFTRPGAAFLTFGLGPWQLVATVEGLVALAAVLGRAWLSLLAAGLLTATTPFPDLLAGLQALGLPRVLVALISFLYRYLFVLVDEAERLWRARESRSARAGPGSGRSVGWRAQVLGRMIGSLFIRSYERSERVYQAMVARGFRGEIKSLALHRVPAADLQLGAALLLVLAAIVAGGYLSVGSG